MRMAFHFCTGVPRASPTWQNRRNLKFPCPFCSTHSRSFDLVGTGAGLHPGSLKYPNPITCSFLPAPRRAYGTPLASPDALEVTTMFAMSAILIGVLGIFYVRRRTARKKSA
jgi:hypothetical protein